jgi:hypothetical protein
MSSPSRLWLARWSTMELLVLTDLKSGEADGTQTGNLP